MTCLGLKIIVLRDETIAIPCISEACMSAVFYDTHAHLDYPEFAAELDELVKRVPWKRMLSIRRSRANCLTSILKSLLKPDLIALSMNAPRWKIRWRSLSPLPKPSGVYFIVSPILSAQCSVFSPSAHW